MKLLGKTKSLGLNGVPDSLSAFRQHGQATAHLILRHAALTQLPGATSSPAIACSIHIVPRSLPDGQA
jgi:hypothetical protein